MTESPATTDWRKLREFSTVDLTRSFVLSWHLERSTLVMDIDVFLTPDHPFYEKPRPAEKICIRPAVLEFPLCDEVSVQGRDKASLSKIVPTLGLGAISGMLRHDNGRHEISGEFGTVFVDSERPLLRLKGP